MGPCLMVQYNYLKSRSIFASFIIWMSICTMSICYTYFIAITMIMLRNIHPYFIWSSEFKGFFGKSYGHSTYLYNWHTFWLVDLFEGALTPLFLDNVLQITLKYIYLQVKAILENTLFIWSFKCLHKKLVLWSCLFILKFRGA